MSASSKSTITAPPSVTFTRGRWTSISSLAGLQGKEEGDETVDALDAIDDWEDDSAAATAKPSSAQPAASSEAQEEQKVRSGAVLPVSASEAELGDVDDDELDVGRVDRLRARQRQEQERQAQQVKMLNGRWVRRAEEEAEEGKAAAGDELDDIPDFADDDTAAPAVAQSSSSSLSSLPRVSPPLSSSASTSSHSHSSSASSALLQSIVDEMSDDSAAASPSSRSAQSQRVTVQQFDRLAAGIRVLRLSSDGQLQPRTLRLLPSTVPTAFSPAASLPYYLRWGQSRAQPNLMQLSLSGLALQTGRSGGHFPSLPPSEEQRLKDEEACFSASNDRLCLSVVCEGGREQRDLMMRAIRQRQKDWGGLQRGWQQQQQQQGGEDGKVSGAEESKWATTQEEEEEEEQEVEPSTGAQAVEQQESDEESDEVNRRSSVIRDSDVQSVLELSLSVEDEAAGSHPLRTVITADEQDDLAAWQDDAADDDVPLPLPSPALPSSSSPSAASVSTSGRSKQELREFDFNADWLQAMQVEAVEYASRRPASSSAAPAVPAVSWEQLREFARLYHAEVDGSEMDDICDHDDFGHGDDDDDEDEDEEEEGEEDEAAEEEEDDAELTEEDGDALQSRLDSMKAAAVVQAEDEDVDWGDAG